MHKPKINLLLGIHCHQPVGNFRDVFQQAYLAAYLPFIKTISQFPNIKFSLHYSGSLLDWLRENQPDFLKDIRNLVAKGQVEIMGGAYYEAILPLIDEQDAIRQIELLKQAIKELFSYDAGGLWLTERIWEPSIPFLLSQAGISYTIVDDFHFQNAGFEPADLNGYYISEDRGKKICLFAGVEKLRYQIPFKLTEEIIEYFRSRLRNSHNDITITYADDGEKFGLWPGTYKWVYTEGWLVDFLSGLEKNRDWINTLTFSEFIHKAPASGRVYLPCCSYREMMEWSNGNFRNFFVRYEEANNMYRRMWYVSNKIKNSQLLNLNSQLNEPLEQKNSPRAQLNEARRHLYMAQDNDAYWHGVFGGFYLHHLRASIYSHLIEAEKIVNSLSTNHGIEVRELDFNLDGNNEIIMNSHKQSLYFIPSCQGGLFEWDYNPKSLNLTNTIRRRYERYHQRLKEKTDSSKADSALPLSIHHLNRVKQDILQARLTYDITPRYSLIERFISHHTKLEDFSDNQYEELGDFLNKAYAYEIIRQSETSALRFWREGRVRNAEVELSKHIIFDSTWLSKHIDLRAKYELENLSITTIQAIFAVEFNLSLYEPTLSNTRGKITANKLTLNDTWFNLRIDFFFDRSTDIWYFPVETISDSEAGIERTYQQLCLLFHWQINLKPKDTWKISLAVGVC